MVLDVHDGRTPHRHEVQENLTISQKPWVRQQRSQLGHLHKTLRLSEENVRKKNPHGLGLGRSEKKFQDHGPQNKSKIFFF